MTDDLPPDPPRPKYKRSRTREAKARAAARRKVLAAERRNKARRKKKPETRGRPKIDGAIRLYHRAFGKRLRFVISDDIVQRLMRLHDSIYRGILPSYMMKAREKYLRMEFVRFIDLSIPGVLMRIEQPTFDPRGNKLRRTPNGHQWECEINARRVGVRSDMTAKIESFYETEDNHLRGVVINFFEENMLPPDDRARPAGVSRPADPEDLRA